ncbi:Uncharacterised protein [Streptococcus pneumoniae]|nr:Uncharacterised protein [Streptococcus pneumoniae]
MRQEHLHQLDDQVLQQGQRLLGFLGLEMLQLRSLGQQLLALQQLEQSQILLGQEHDEPTFHQYHEVVCRQSSCLYQILQSRLG